MHFPSIKIAGVVTLVVRKYMLSSANKANNILRLLPPGCDIIVSDITEEISIMSSMLTSNRRHSAAIVE